MNIFVFSPNLAESSRYFFDRDPRRANKQILELTQCLATVLHERGIAVPKKDGTPYKPTHKNHPVVVWLRENENHALWSADYLGALLREYWIRTDRNHGCMEAYLQMLCSLPVNFPTVTPIHHGQGVPRTGDVYKDYRDYLAMKLENDKKK